MVKHSTRGWPGLEDGGDGGGGGDSSGVVVVVMVVESEEVALSPKLGLALLSQMSLSQSHWHLSRVRHHKLND